MPERHAFAVRSDLPPLKFGRPCATCRHVAKALKRRSSARRPIAHGQNPPCHRLARPTLPRPPHPRPTSVTIAIRPSGGPETGEVLKLICPTWLRDIFGFGG